MRIDEPVASRLSAAALLLMAGCAGVPVRPQTGTEPPSRPQRIAIGEPATRLDHPPDDASSSGTPASEGVMHTLMPGQTLYSIARAYRVPIDTLLRVNGIADPRSIPDGRAIFIPGALRPIDIAPSFTPAGGRSPGNARERSPGPAESTNASMLDLPGERLPDTILPRPGSGEPGSRPGDRNEPGLTSVDLAWPLRGAITSRFGSRRRRAHHAGIDIDGVLGEEILAAAPGTIQRADKEAGYGRTVVIDHGRGITTLYAHASRLLVREGDRVEAGEAIALVGRSGNARGSHLHFEIHRNGRPVDPLPLLRTGAVPAADAR